MKEILFEFEDAKQRYDSWYEFVDHPTDPRADYKCFRLIRGDFKGLIYRYGKFQFSPRKNPNGTKTLQYEYDVIDIPDNILGRKYPNKKGEEFYDLLANILMEVIEDWDEGKKEEVVLNIKEVKEEKNEPIGNNNIEGAVTRRTFYPAGNPFSKE